MATILIINSEPTVQDLLHQALADSYRLVSIQNIYSASLQVESPDLLILDATRPDHDAATLCRQIRAMPYAKRTPIIVLISYRSAQEVAQLLDAGADICLRKPIVSRELAARVRALLRRTRRAPERALLTLHPERRIVQFEDRYIELTPTEYGLLEALCAKPGEHKSTTALLQQVWNYPPGTGDPALVRNHVRNLRLKLETDPDRPRIVTCYQGRGYTISAEIVRASARQAS
jgi:two-component system response regulator RpaA